MTLAGSALGVAVLVGVLSANETTSRMLDRNLGTDDGGVQVHPTGAYFADIETSVLDQVAALPGVADAFGNVWFRALPGGAEPGPESELWINASDHREGTAKPRPSEDADRGRGRPVTNGAEEVTLSPGAARRLGVDLGDTVALAVPSGTVDAKVVGVWPYGQDNGLHTSMATARRWAGRGDVYDNVSLFLGEDVDVTQWIEEHDGALGTGLRLQAEGTGPGGLRSVVRLTQAAYAGIASTAVFVGAFLTYLTLSTAALERRRLYGTLRALGAGRGQILRLVLAEAVVLGVVATIVGLMLGAVVARLMTRFVAALYELGPVEVSLPARVVVTGIAVGIGVTVLAALVPALRASRIQPAEAIRGTISGEVRLSRAWLAGGVAMAVGVGVALAPTGEGFELATLLILLGAVFLVPPVLRPVARVVGGVTRRLSPGVGDAAVMHLVKERSRSAYTLGLVMVVLAMVFAVTATRASFLTTLDRMFSRTFAGDVTVYSDRIDEATEKQIESTPGIGASTRYRFGSTRVVGDHPLGDHVQLFMIEPASYFAFQSFWWADGDDDTARAALDGGDAVLLPEVLADRTGAGRGDTVTLETAEGPHAFRVAGLYTTLEVEPRVITGIVDGRRWFRADRPDAIVLQAAQEVDPEDLVALVREHTGSRADLNVVAVDVEQSAIANDIERNFSAFLAVVLVAAVVGLLGLANTLGMTVLQRTREIGVLRTVGVQRSQLRAMVLVESATLVAVAGLLAVPLGLLLSATIIGSASRALGVFVDFVFPWAAVPALLASAAVIAGLAALLPARRAAHVDPVVALRFD